MPTPAEMKDKLWAAVKSDRTMMLGLTGVDGAHTRAMAAVLDGDEGPIWFAGGESDPKLALLRCDAAEAEIWYDPSDLLSAVKLLVGTDPKTSHRDNVAEVQLR